MKKSIISSILFITLILHFNTSIAQVKGNGKITIQEIDIKSFEKLHINFPVQLNLDANAEYSLTITTDENIFPEIVLENKNNQLSILQDKWIQPSTMVQVTIGTKGLTTFTTSGYGNTNIFNLNENKLTINNEVGKVTLSGKVNHLIFNMKKGDLYAKNLEAQHVKGSISSSGKAFVNAIASIDAKVTDNGKIVYDKKPSIFKVDEKDNGKVISLQEETSKSTKISDIKYVKVNLRNNRFTRIHTYVKGPPNKNFSYGMPFNPKQKRAENYPVGTKIYKVSKYGSKKLLLTIKADDEGKVVDLFEES